MRTTRNRTAMSEINVTPFVDVMLVLLVIFMVTAPLLQQGIDIELPEAKGKNLPPQERLTVTIRANGKLTLNDKDMSLSELQGKLEALSPTQPEVFLKADKKVPYGLVVKVMGRIKEAGIEKLGIVTEPETSG